MKLMHIVISATINTTCVNTESFESTANLPFSVSLSPEIPNFLVLETIPTNNPAELCLKSLIS